MEKRFDILDFKTLNDFSYALMKVRHELVLCKIYRKEENIDDFFKYISQLYCEVCLEQSKRYADLSKKFDYSLSNSLIHEYEEND